jgi:hypothetical protein
VFGCSADTAQIAVIDQRQAANTSPPSVTVTAWEGRLESTPRGGLRGDGIQIATAMGGGGTLRTIRFDPLQEGCARPMSTTSRQHSGTAGAAGTRSQRMLQRVGKGRAGSEEPTTAGRATAALEPTTRKKIKVGAQSGAQAGAASTQT